MPGCRESCYWTCQYDPMDDLIPLNKGDISTMRYNAIFALNNFWLLGNDYGYGQKSNDMIISFGICGGLSYGWRSRRHS